MLIPDIFWQYNQVIQLDLWYDTTFNASQCNQWPLKSEITWCQSWNQQVVKYTVRVRFLYGHWIDIYSTRVWVELCQFSWTRCLDDWARVEPPVSTQKLHLSKFGPARIASVQLNLTTGPVSTPLYAWPSHPARQVDSARIRLAEQARALFSHVDSSLRIRCFGFSFSM